MAQILTHNAGRYVAAFPSPAVPQVQSTLAKLTLCRTPALGGHKYRCSGCPHEVTVHNSCGDRNCPTCGGARRSNWLESTRELIFAGIDHFQVVFTLPAELSPLALGNRKLVYNLLFSSAWSALKQTIQSEHGFESAAVMVLHTWNQKLDAHAHVHAVVPGCGPASDGSGVRFAQRDADPSTIGHYLVDAKDLRTAYRETFLQGLNRLRHQGLLKLTGEFAKYDDDQVWSELLAELEQTNWVSFIQPPPHAGGSASQVMKYLARYLTGGPISDRRIISTEDDSVTFLARPGDVRGGEAKQVPITLTQVEFTRRWCLHILPKGYTRTRRFGGWSNTGRQQYLERLAIQLESLEPALPLLETATEFGPWDDDAIDPADGQANEDLRSSETACPNCGWQLIPQRATAKPSWTQIMASPNRPKWYRRPN